jgi:hypothetical protein
VLLIFKSEKNNCIYLKAKKSTVLANKGVLISGEMASIQSEV